MLLFAVCWKSIFIVIPPGHLGVRWLRFGGGTERIGFLSEGTRLSAPWDKIYQYDGRLQRSDQVVKALTVDGLSVVIELSLTFVVNPDRLGDLQTEVGPDYIRTLIIPVVLSQLSLFVASKPVDEMYSLGRSDIDRSIVDNIARRLSNVTTSGADHRPLIYVIGLNISEIDLPPLVRGSIEKKVSAEEDVQRMRYLIAREQGESQRRTIEADATKRVQALITPGLTEPYLRWQSNDNLLKLSTSSNGKVVVLQGGDPAISSFSIAGEPNLDLHGRVGSADPARAPESPPSATPR